MHHSGPGRLARPYPVEDSHLLFFASLSWRTQSRVKAIFLPCLTEAADLGFEQRAPHLAQRRLDMLLRERAAPRQAIENSAELFRQAVEH